MSETMDWQTVTAELSERLTEAEALITYLTKRNDWNPTHVAALARKYVQTQRSRLDSIAPAYSVGDDGRLYPEERQ